VGIIETGGGASPGEGGQSAGDSSSQGGGQ
jgi:hypothetical protein